MSRCGYSDDIDNWALIRWRGAVASAIRGARGQAMLRELLAALDAMPEKRLVADALSTADGQFCTLGALAHARGIDMGNIDPEDRAAVAELFGIAEALAAEVMFMNDESFSGCDLVTVEICGPMRPRYPDWGNHTRTVWVPKNDADAARWSYMRQWVASQIEGEGR